MYIWITRCVVSPPLPPCLTDQTDCPFLSYSICMEQIASVLVRIICLIPEKTPSSHGRPYSPPQGPGPHGAGSLMMPQATWDIQQTINLMIPWAIGESLSVCSMFVPIQSEEKMMPCYVRWARRVSPLV